MNQGEFAGAPGHENAPHTAAPAGHATYCRACGRQMDPRAAFCPFDGVPQQMAPMPMASAAPPLPPLPPSQKSSGLAILLHVIFPGAGHLYAGISHKATGYLIASVISVLLWFTLFGIPIAIIIWLVAFIAGLGDVQAAVRAYNNAIGAPEIVPPGF